MFHRAEDIYAMWGPDVLRKAYRITAYKGMLALRLEVQRQSAAPESAPARPPGASTRRPAATSRPAAGRLPEGAKVVPVAAMAMKMPGLFERRRVPAPGVEPPAEAPVQDTTPHD